MKTDLKQSTESGFTLIEMLAIVVIIGIMSGLGYADFDAMRDQLALKRAAYQLAQDIRKAQEMAMSNAALPPGQPTPYGYGIYIDLDSADNYLLYADTSNISGDQNDPTGWGYYNLTEGASQDYTKSDYPYQTINVAENPVFILRFKDLSGCDQTYSKVSAEFVPPNPDTKIFDVSSPGTANKVDSVQIVLALPSALDPLDPEKITDPAKIKCVSINQAGLIAINDACGTCNP